MSAPARPRRRAHRDQAESSFNLILEDFLEIVPFARGAAIVDTDGETVDYAGELDPFDLRVAAATFQIVMCELRSCPYLSRLQQISVPMGRAGYLLRVLDPSYSLLIVLRTLGTYSVSPRALLELESRILTEAGLARVRPLRWHRVDVKTNERSTRPVALRPAFRAWDPEAPEPGPWMSVEILGTVVGVGTEERGYRVRLPTGAEIMLLREKSRLWFSDERMEEVMRETSPAGRKALFNPEPAPPPQPAPPPRQSAPRPVSAFRPPPKPPVRS